MKRTFYQIINDNEAKTHLLRIISTVKSLCFLFTPLKYELVMVF